MISLETIFVILIIISLLLITTEDKNPKKIYKFYSVKGKWFYLKYYFISFLLCLKRSLIYLLGKRCFYKIEEMEKFQNLSKHKEAFDAVFFQAVSQNGVCFSAGIERRHNNKLAGLVYIVHPDYGLLESEQCPHTALNADILPDNTTIYSGGGISFSRIIPMKKWKVSYKGLMKFQNDPTKSVEVKYEAYWTSTYDWFFFEDDTPIGVIAKAVATEPWTIQLFKNLGSSQRHYEQMGYINGTLQIDGKITKLVNVSSFRDHSFGFKRDWSLMHRLIYCMFYLPDRTKIVFGVVSEQHTLSHIQLGYISHPNGKLDAIEYSDLMLYQHGEDGTLPNKLDFTFKASGKSYQVKMTFKHTVMNYKGSKEEAILYERFGDCEVNGVKGKSVSDWHYNKKNI